MSLSPCKIVTIVFRRIGSHIASCPHNATRQAKIHVLMYSNAVSIRGREAHLFAINKTKFRNGIRTHIISSVGLQAPKRATETAYTHIIGDMVTVNVRIRRRAPTHPSQEHMAVILQHHCSTCHRTHRGNIRRCVSHKLNWGRVCKDKTNHFGTCREIHISTPRFKSVDAASPNAI